MINCAECFALLEEEDKGSSIEDLEGLYCCKCIRRFNERVREALLMRFEHSKKRETK